MHLERFRAQALHLAATLVPASRCCIYEVGPDLEPTRHVILGDDTRYIGAYLNQFRACDPFHPRYFAETRRSVFRTNEGGGTPAQRERYVSGFMSPMGVRFKAEMFLRDERGGIIAGLRLSRRDAMGEFRDTDIAALEAMQPLMESALRAARSRERLAGVEDLLTAREREVFQCMLDGLPNKVIGGNLGLALPTVKSHIKNIFQKIGATSRAEAISQIFRLG